MGERIDKGSRGDMAQRTILQKRVKELFDYNPKTGEFFRLLHKGGKIKKGWFSGSKHPEGHLIIRADNTRFYAHRLAWIYMYGEISEGLMIDHINGKRDDNRICNLRLATPKQNSANIGVKHTASKLQQHLQKIIASNL